MCTFYSPEILQSGAVKGLIYVISPNMMNKVFCLTVELLVYFNLIKIN